MTADPKVLALANALKDSADNAGCDPSLIVVGAEELEALLSHIATMSTPTRILPDQCGTVSAPPEEWEGAR